MDNTTKSQIISLIHQEVIPAIGCTEPVAVALAAAKAAEVLGHRPEKIEVLLSANILKNAMGVGIPGTGMVGLPIAVDRKVCLRTGGAAGYNAGSSGVGKGHDRE